MKPGNMNRLDTADAKAVQVIHTNAGYYGEVGRVGHVDFCVNGGRHQPYCGNSTSNIFGHVYLRLFTYYIYFTIVDINLCSHIWSICYLAQSLFDEEPIAEPCNRRCPSGLNNGGPFFGNGGPAFNRRSRQRMGFAVGYSIPMGQRTPMK
jgi:phosphatidylserine sn-1 acylhydrolase